MSIRFLTGDELGNIKSVRYTRKNKKEEQKSELVTIHQGNGDPIKALSVCNGLVAAARASGSGSLFTLDGDSTLESVQEWKETRIKPGQSYIGLTLTKKNIYTCTSNGALRLTPLAEPEAAAAVTPTLSVLPSRLCDWKLSPNEGSFAYGGDEVELSVWDTERAFSTPPPKTTTATTDATPGIKKRKRNDALFPAEIWRARNVPNDFLGLRQPVRITSLAYLQQSHHILTGTQLGNVRRYDTRAGRRPVNDWEGIGKVGGVGVVEKGFHEHEAIVSDQGGNLYSLDLRNGRIIYGYKSISGAIISLAPTPSPLHHNQSTGGILASTAQDRYTRFHSTFSPPTNAGDRQDRKGEVLDKVFMKSPAGVVVWDGVVETRAAGIGGEDGEADEEVWEGMEAVGET